MPILHQSFGIGYAARSEAEGRAQRITDITASHIESQTETAVDTKETEKSFARLDTVTFKFSNLVHVVSRNVFRSIAADVFRSRAILKVD